MTLPEFPPDFVPDPDRLTAMAANLRAWRDDLAAELQCSVATDDPSLPPIRAVALLLCQCAGLRAEMHMQRGSARRPEDVSGRLWRDGATALRAWEATVPG